MDREFVGKMGLAALAIGALISLKGFMGTHENIKIVDLVKDLNGPPQIVQKYEDKLREQKYLLIGGVGFVVGGGVAAYRAFKRS